MPTNEDPAVHGDVYVNRTLNLRSIDAIGYDLDYTLIRYRWELWERAVYERAVESLSAQGVHIGPGRLDPTNYIQGLFIDLRTGALVKATHHGWVVIARRAGKELSYEETRRTYAGQTVDLANPRFTPLHSLFGGAEAGVFDGLVRCYSKSDQSRPDFQELRNVARETVDAIHAQGSIRTRIHSDPDRYILPDPDVVPTLTEQVRAGKRLAIVTNSDWPHSRTLLEHLCRNADGHPEWKQLFHTIIVSAEKPDFFGRGTKPVRIDPDSGQPMPDTEAASPDDIRVYIGGSAKFLETSLGVRSNRILFVGDHLFGDIQTPRALRRWRTALVIQELEDEMLARAAFRNDQVLLERLMAEKSAMQAELATRQLANSQADEPTDVPVEPLVDAIGALDQRLAPLARKSRFLGNEKWGPLMRAGAEKSMFGFLVERYADIYMPRVSSLRPGTPFAYYRSQPSLMAHEQTTT